MKVHEVVAVLEERAPAAWAYSWDKPGLRIGNPSATVSGVLVALTLTRAVFEKARSEGADLLVLHHPPVWRALDVIRTDDPETRLLLDVAAAGIACYAAHTNLDVAPGGVSAQLAEKLGLLDTRPLIPAPHATQVKLVTFVPEEHLARVRDAVCAAGAGVIGDYTQCSFSTPGVGTFLPGDSAEPYSGEKGRVNEEPERRLEVLVSKARLPRVLQALFEAHPYEEVAYDVVCLENWDDSIGLGCRGRLAKPMELDGFARHVRDALELSHVRYAGDPRRRVENVAVIGGAGGSEFRHVPRGIDALVTGDVRYHDATDALERGLSVVDAGHEGTERFIVSSLTELLASKFPTLSISPYTEPEVFRLA